MREALIARQFRGPPNSGNGGYVCGLLGREFEGPATAVLRAIVPLDTPMPVSRADGRLRMSHGEVLVGEAWAADPSELPDVWAPPSLADAMAATLRSPTWERPLHPPCFSCSLTREEGDGLRVAVGQVEGMAPGYTAGVWTPHANFADEDGLVPPEIVWAALDCPGSIAWLVEGHPVGLLGTMTGEAPTLPKAGEPHIVTAWPLGIEGRKHFAGVALFDAEGALLARGRQIWIARNPARAPSPTPAA
jgi:hypothetical protein